jgi:hypothetical protein
LGPVPRPDPKARYPTKEEFEAWCADPVTRFVATGVRVMIEDLKSFWVQKSWDGGSADQTELDQLTARADAHASFLQATWEDYVSRIDASPSAAKA